MATKRFKLAACTAQHIGDRAEQQDRVGIFTCPRLPGSALFVLADGMGGKTGGAMAAMQVMSTAKNLFENFMPVAETPQQLLTEIATESHTVIRLSALSEEKEPHSTLVALLLQPHRADWAHVGDSRLYHFHHEKLVTRTADHSLVEQMVAQGKINREQAAHHKLSNVLVNALGMAKAPKLSFGHVDELRTGDSFLICSDGLWAYFSESELGQLMHDEGPRKASENLLAAARERADGHGDNCTMAIAKLEPAPVPAPLAAPNPYASSLRR